MSTTPNEAPVPEAPHDYQSPYQPSYGSKEAPPVPAAPPQAHPSVNYGYPPSQEAYSQAQQPAVPAYIAPPAPQPVYYPEAPYQGVQPPYQAQGQPVYQQNIPGYLYPAPLPSPGQQAASTSLTMGIVATVITVIFGWIPLIGLFGVAGGVGFGIPAILGAKKAEEQGVNATAGKTLGWVAVGLSAFFVLVYVFLMIVGAATDSTTTV